MSHRAPFSGEQPSAKSSLEPVHWLSSQLRSSLMLFGGGGNLSWSIGTRVTRYVERNGVWTVGDA